MLVKILFLPLLFIAVPDLPKQESPVEVEIIWVEQSDYPDDEVIYYSPERKLKWNDFLGTPAATSASAATSSGFGYYASWESAGTTAHLKIEVYCFFHKYKSWVWPGKMSDDVLEHEQHHFDITYSFTRMFEDELRKCAFTYDNFEDKIENLYKTIFDRMNIAQNEFDSAAK